MGCVWLDHMVSLSSSGPAGVPLAILLFLWTRCQSTTYLFTQNSVWLLSRFILPIPARYSAAFLCEDEGRLIPVLFCNAQEHLITCRQNPWPRKGATRPVLLGRGWGCGNQWQGGSLISVWAAIAPLPIRLNSTQASQINNTRLLPAPPRSARAPYPPPELPSALEQASSLWLLLFIRLMYAEQSIGLFRSSFVLVFCVCRLVALSRR